MGVSPGGRPINEAPLGVKPLWHHAGFKLPGYIRGVARGINPADPDSAIDIAVSRMRVWAVTSKDPAVRAAAAKAIAEFDAERAAAHRDLAREAVGLVIDLASQDGHHIKGTAFHFRHGWHPLDVYTALKSRKAKIARELHGSGASYFNAEPEGVKDAPRALPHPSGHILGVTPKAPEPEPEPPKPEPARRAVPPNDEAAEKAKRLKIFTKQQKERYGPRVKSDQALHSFYSDGALHHAASVGDQKAADHLEARAATNDIIERARAGLGGAGSDDGNAYRQVRFNDLNDPVYRRRQETAFAKNIASNRSRAAKNEAAQAAVDAARAKRDADPEAVDRLREELTDKNNTDNIYSWPVEDVEKLAAAGHVTALRALPYLKKRAAKRAVEAKKSADLLDRLRNPSHDGDPVSKSVDLQVTGEVKKNVQNALDAIDSVHSDGELIKTPVKRSDANRKYGQYTGRSNKDDQITVSTGGDHHGLTFAHEVGHWLDHRALGAGQSGAAGHYKSEQAANAGQYVLGSGTQGAVEPEWAEWWKAVSESDAVKQLAAKISQDPTYSRYTRTPWEIWARSYAQYIATRSGDPTLRKNVADLVSLREASDSRSLQGYSQWTDEEFEPIAAAIDKIIAAKGWKK